MAFQLAAAILIGTLAGKKLDSYFQTESPYFTALLSILALFAGMYLSLKDLLFRKKK